MRVLVASRNILSRLPNKALQQSAQTRVVGRRALSPRRPTMICAAAERQVR
jgi:hypothetical protein